MKMLVSIVLLIAAVSTTAPADVLIRSVYRTDTIVDGSVQSSESAGAEVLWIGKDRLAYRTQQLQVVIDRSRGKVLFAVPARQAFLEMSLPLDTAKLRATLDAAGFRVSPAHGKVRATDETREVQGASCRRYEVETWQLEGETPVNRRRFLVWAAEKLPGHEVDLSLVDEMLACLRAFYNRDEGYCEELRKIRGLQLRLEMDAGQGERYVEEAIEIAEKTPPAGTYEAPEGYGRLGN